MSTETHAVDTNALYFTSLVTADGIEETRTRLGSTLQEIGKAIAGSTRPRVYALGGGASNAAMHGLKYLLDRFSDVPSDVQTGWQFVSRNPVSLDENSFLFLTSYSGQTPEILEAQQMAKAAGAKVIAITETDQTPLAKSADWVLDYRNKAVFTVPLALVYQVAGQVLLAQGAKAPGNQILDGIAKLPDAVAKLNEPSNTLAQKLAAEVPDVGMFYVLGTGPNYGLAYKLALSVVIENLWLDSAPVDSGEFYHGPIEIIAGDPKLDNSRAFLHLVGTDASRTVSQQAIDFCTKKGARQLVFDAKDYPDFGELFAPFALFVPTEWWVMHMAAQKNHDVDERRYMGKIGARWGEYA
ncbi:MAG: SIS domain-containing protein [Thermomicrobiales bacterium]|nr:SIS domain-containing protein [Thermomicrobiales bacterium]MCO5220253.1 SIS domain-containing protein [Thermomicrobiales bacterium]